MLFIRLPGQDHCTLLPLGTVCYAHIHRSSGTSPRGTTEGQMCGFRRLQTMRDKCILKYRSCLGLHCSVYPSQNPHFFFCESKVEGKQQLIRLKFLSNHISHLAVLLQTPENLQHEICFHIRCVDLCFCSLSSSTKLLCKLRVFDMLCACTSKGPHLSPALRVFSARREANSVLKHRNMT